MPAWCAYYHQPPREFWNLTPEEYERMMRFANNNQRPAF